MDNVRRISVPVDRDLERDLERARQEFAQRTGVRASLGGMASALLRQAVKGDDDGKAA
jgi:hypothetical protein